MLSIDEVNGILDDIADEIPEPFFNQLNGGIILSEDIQYHREDLAGNLYTLGEYHNDRNMGRYIVIYYGSFSKVYPNAGEAVLKAQLKRVLLHEFTHHVESLSGERGLEYKDAKKIADYRRKMGI